MNLSIKDDLAERRSFLDPHSGKKTKIHAGLARAAIVDVARDKWNRIFVLDAWADRAKTDEIIEQIINHYYRWHPGTFGIDGTAQQNLFVDTVRTILRLRGQGQIHIEGYPAPTHIDKMYRIRTVIQPVIAEHRLFIRDDLIELRTELAAFPTGSTCDLVDALAGAISMFPPAITADEEYEQGEEVYAEHLRDCGLNEDEVYARLVEEFGDDSDSY